MNQNGDKKCTLHSALFMLRCCNSKFISVNVKLLNQREDGEQSSEVNEFSSLDDALLQEQVTILNARLDQRSSEYDQLKIELNRTKEDCINLQGIKHGLQSRLSDQEQVMMKLKAELLKLSFSYQAANSDKGELQKLLEERDREIALLRSELVSKNNQLDQQKRKLETALTRATEADTLEVCLRRRSTDPLSYLSFENLANQMHSATLYSPWKRPTIYNL